MTVTLLEQPIADGGIRSVNFFNGRLLTGSDLSREQLARATADQRAAQAAGSGIAWGLEVTAGPKAADGGLTVTVKAGLALSRSGRTLWLDSETNVALGHRAPPRVARTKSFDNCGALTGGSYAAGPGIYLLTLAPVEDREGKALTNALDDADVPCNTDTRVDAVRFRLLPLDNALKDEVDAVNQRSPAPDAAARISLLRNRIAHRCFGTDALARFIADPLGGTSDDYGLLAGPAGTSLSKCEVPLAIVKLDIGIDFVDMWTVRRRITRPGAAGPWGMACDDRRMAEGEACFMQFQGQVADKTVQIAAQQQFDFLPAAGILPMDGGDKEATAQFFASLTVRGPTYIEGARLPALLRMANQYPPIDLSTGELIWLYRVRQNQERIDYQIRPQPAPCLLFVSGHVPYQADARFNLSRWDYANAPIDR